MKQSVVSLHTDSSIGDFSVVFYMHSMISVFVISISSFIEPFDFFFRFRYLILYRFVGTRKSLTTVLTPLLTMAQPYTVMFIEQIVLSIAIV